MTLLKSFAKEIFSTLMIAVMVVLPIIYENGAENNQNVSTGIYELIPLFCSTSIGILISLHFALDLFGDYRSKSVISSRNVNLSRCSLIIDSLFTDIFIILVLSNYQGRKCLIPLVALQIQAVCVLFGLSSYIEQFFLDAVLTLRLGRLSYYLLTLSLCINEIALIFVVSIESWLQVIVILFVCFSLLCIFGSAYIWIKYSNCLLSSITAQDYTLKFNNDEKKYYLTIVASLFISYSVFSVLCGLIFAYFPAALNLEWNNIIMSSMKNICIYFTLIQESMMSKHNFSKVVVSACSTITIATCTRLPRKISSK